LFRSSDLNTVRTILAASDASLNSLSIGLNSSGVLRLIRNSTEVSVLSEAGGFPNDEWVSLIFSFNSDTEAVVYRNGELLYTATFASSTLPGILTNFVVASRRHPSPTAYWTARFQHVGYLRRAATLEDAQTFDATGIIPNAEGLFPLTSNSTTIEYNIGTEGEPFARRNRLTQSTNYNLSPWGPVTVGAGVNPVVTPNVAVAPDGSLTADQIDFNRGGTGASDQSEWVQTFSQVFALGENATSAIWLKAATPGDVGKQVAWRHVAAGAYGVITLTADWVRYTRTEISIAGGSNIRIGSRQGFSADVTVSVHVWNSQIELGTSATDDQIIHTGIYTNEMSLINGAAGMLYTGRDVPFSRQNEVGYSLRRNLLVRTEEFNDAVWSKSNATVTVNAINAPNGTLTADKLVGNSGFNSPCGFSQSATVSSGAFCSSLYLKAAEATWFRLFISGSGEAWFNLSGAVVGTATSDIQPVIENVGDGWYRCTIIKPFLAAGTYTIGYRLANGNNSTSFTGDGSGGIFIWGAQFELGPTATEYQRIGTNPGTSVLFPATLSPGKSAAGDDLQFAGPVPMNGQAEESNCFSFDGVDDYVQFTPADMDAIAAADQVVNGTFAADSDWTKGTGWTISGGTANKSAGTASNLDQAQTLTVGRSYLITYTITRTAGTLNVALSGGTTVNGANRTASGTYTEVLVAVTGNNNLRFAADSSFAGTLDNVIVKELPVITSQGTSTVTYRSQGDGITGTAGTAYEIKLGTAEEIPCSEGDGATVHGVLRNKAYNVINGQVSNWGTTQNQFHYNLIHGCSQINYDADALTYITAVETADGQLLELSVRQAINDFIIGCKSDGIWNAIKASCILAGARTLNGALVPLKGSTPTNFNFVSGDYNRETGLVGDGATKYLNSNRNNNADPQNSHHIAVFRSGLPTSGAARVSIGFGRPAVTGATRIAESSSIARQAVIRSRNGGAVTVNNGIAVGFCGISRNDSTGYTFRGNSISTALSTASEVPTSGNFYVFAAHGNLGGAEDLSNERIQFYSIGEAIGLALLDARLTILMESIGEAI
jgi:hypothetical protein